MNETRGKLSFTRWLLHRRFDLILKTSSLRPGLGRFVRSFASEWFEKGARVTSKSKFFFARLPEQSVLGTVVVKYTWCLG